jgi:apolipoprotein D and lipocalin family protein
MLKQKPQLYMMLLTLFGISFSCAQHPPLEVVEKVELARYAGRWYEIANIPIRAQRGCQCTYAEYGLSEKGYVTVYNRCVTAEGKVKDIRGKAFPVAGSNNAKLKVQFFWPFRADYQIIALAEDYSYALVGSPNRKYLWILSRESQLSDERYQALLAIASERGFNVGLLEKTPHPCE